MSMKINKNRPARPTLLKDGTVVYPRRGGYYELVASANSAFKNDAARSEDQNALMIITDNSAAVQVIKKLPFTLK